MPLLRHCWTDAITGAGLFRNKSPVDRWTNAAGIGSVSEPAAAPMPTRASQRVLPGVGTPGHVPPVSGVLLKMIAALAFAAAATETF